MSHQDSKRDIPVSPEFSGSKVKGKGKVVPVLK
jgi:hypothetical protein